MCISGLVLWILYYFGQVEHWWVQMALAIILLWYKKYSMLYRVYYILNDRGKTFKRGLIPIITKVTHFAHFRKHCLLMLTLAQLEILQCSYSTYNLCELWACKCWCYKCTCNVVTISHYWITKISTQSMAK